MSRAFGLNNERIQVLEILYNQNKVKKFNIYHKLYKIISEYKTNLNVNFICQ